MFSVFRKRRSQSSDRSSKSGKRRRPIPGCTFAEPTSTPTAAGSRSKPRPEFPSRRSPDSSKVSLRDVFFKAKGFVAAAPFTCSVQSPIKDFKYGPWSPSMYLTLERFRTLSHEGLVFFWNSKGLDL